MKAKEIAEKYTDGWLPKGAYIREVNEMQSDIQSAIDEAVKGERGDIKMLCTALDDIRHALIMGNNEADKGLIEIADKVIDRINQKEDKP